MADRLEEIGVAETEPIATPEEAPITEAPAVTEEETVTGSMMSHTTDELPELSGRAIGDMITFTISNISDDGKTYDMTVSEEGEAPFIEEEVSPVAGREAVRGAFI